MSVSGIKGTVLFIPEPFPLFLLFDPLPDTKEKTTGKNLKVIFLNDGPGLLLGSTWRDYAYIENLWPGLVKVVTLRMFPERISINWLLSKEIK